MYYFVGDIHAEYRKLKLLLDGISSELSCDDEVIFLGDYIDRGENSYKTVQMLVEFSSEVTCVFLTGNHEDMLMRYMEGSIDKETYFFNGGLKTIKSYNDKFGSLWIPQDHKKIIFNRNYYYEGDNFVAVHAGIRPEYSGDISKCPISDMLWIRDDFFMSQMVWKKTIIFGHTPTHYMHKNFGQPFVDEKSNIIGIDTAAVYGGKLTCLVWPEKKFLSF